MKDNEFSKLKGDLLPKHLLIAIDKVENKEEKAKTFVDFFRQMLKNYRHMDNQTTYNFPMCIRMYTCCSGWRNWRPNEVIQSVDFATGDIVTEFMVRNNLKENIIKKFIEKDIKKKEIDLNDKNH